MNITNPNYDAYVAGLPTGFFNQFDGIAFSLYDTCNGDCTDPHQNPLYSSQLLSNIGASDKKIFGVESGTAGDFFYFKQPPNVNSPLYKYVNGILNNQPSFIEMIGIPSYDLAGEVGHSWSLFEPSDVINLLKNFPDGTNLPASVTVPVTLSKCPGKNYSFYIRDPSQCSECGSELGEIIYPQNSTFCTKEVNFKYQQDLPSSSAPIYSSEDEGITGEFFVDKVELPDFSTMEQNMTKALKKLLPQELNEQMDIQNKILSSEAKHFVTGKTAEEKSTSSTKKAKTKITTDLWWSNLLGQTKILCGLFGTCTAPKSMVIQIEDATQSVKDDADQIACTTIGSETGEKKEETITHEKEFQTTSFFKKLWDALTGKNEESSDFFGTTRGQIAGGASFQSFSDFQRIFIPQEMMDEWEIKTGASIDKTDFSLTVKGKEKTENASVYYTEMEKEKFKRCITLCSIYPAGFDISAIDPMCTSCNPNDYKIDYIDVDKTNCHPIGGEGCDYYSEDTTPRCNGDPICESGKCYHNMYRMNNDYTDRGCPLPYNASGCTLREICVPMTFKKNPNGGFGPCQYTNSNVCVRSDWKDSGTGMCDYLCNWACCAYQ
ncbi:hypothetical protein COT64_02480 [Candidatus Shapirobacteria bacterium CG09_land_8_20_14_0_10_39_12]|uniref:Uncharacterized protein n=1 Tax=Candidatus Shapirobacteria bacterium CG09_land_8_20_14_0_10_39_12 TaxID=1974885 RepID=A0A2H0WPA2_9BACT|nr:MAG: hypothetical protein COT64_02480 [Candidatus Shapirobacteria bacterium CG09_land_8_20_14_0_10_39_12]